MRRRRNTWDTEEEEEIPGESCWSIVKVSVDWRSYWCRCNTHKGIKAVPELTSERGEGKEVLLSAPIRNFDRQGVRWSRKASCGAKHFFMSKYISYQSLQALH